MLKPQQNIARNVFSLNGLWNFQFVKEDEIPLNPLKEPLLMAVPSSFNDIFTNLKEREYSGWVCYETTFCLSDAFQDKQIILRVGSASHEAVVYLNGEEITRHVGGFLPFEANFTGKFQFGKPNRISIRLSNRLDFTTLPMGELVETSGSIEQKIHYDFYNYSGLHRDVSILTLPMETIDDIHVKSTFDDPSIATVSYAITTTSTKVRVMIVDASGKIVAKASGKRGIVTIERPHLWKLGNGYLYTLVASTDSDIYAQSFGIRRIDIKDGGLYLNHELVYLKGFGKHEDFLISGKGNFTPVNLRDFELMKWINANSFRTSHYPYAEELYDLADQYGILVINEIPAVGFNFWSGREVYNEQTANKQTLENHKKTLRECAQRDKNHPCVFCYSLANEANTHEKGAYYYYKELVDDARTYIEQPLMIVEWVGAAENKVASLFDIIGLNRYFGWYTDFANLSVVKDQLTKTLTEYHEKFGKPILLSEFGADTIAGYHQLPALAFSEEFQIEFIEMYRKTIQNLDFVIGEHVWNFADFMTKQGLQRFGGNKKGVFTRDRHPKMVAHYLKKAWEE